MDRVPTEFSFEEVADAHRLIESNDAGGKLVVRGTPT
jgi:hypothetical protein